MTGSFSARETLRSRQLVAFNDAAPLGLRDIAAACENSLSVSTVCTPAGNAKCDQNQVELGAALARVATAEALRWSDNALVIADGHEHDGAF